eukprot:6182054-Prymnesium_polylepis.1
MPLCSGVQPGAPQGPSGRCRGLARRLAHASHALMCRGQGHMDAQPSIRKRAWQACGPLPHVVRTCAWVPSISVALVGPHASMPDDVRSATVCFAFATVELSKRMPQAVDRLVGRRSTASLAGPQLAAFVY